MMEPRNLETKQMEDTTIKRNGMLSLDFISFSHRFLEFIMMFHEFWLSVPSLYLEIFSSLPHQSLHCNIHFHQFSPTCLWFLSLVTRCYAFSRTTWSFYHWRSSFLHIHSLILSWESILPTYLSIFSLGFISFPYLLPHLITRFYLFSPLLPFIRGFHAVPFLLQCVIHYLYPISL